jgi:hypothetical protein
MNGLPGVIMGGDPFSDVFRAFYDLSCFWKLTDPEYCLSVMQAAYDGGCRAFDCSFGGVQDIFLRLRDTAAEPVAGVGNPTWLQGPKLAGRHLQYCRGRIISTIVNGYLEARDASRVRDVLSMENGMVFGYDKDAKPYTESEIASIYLDEDVFISRLDELGECEYILIGGTDADWLFSLRRQDIVERMAEIVRRRKKRPLLLCHYASLVLPAADRMGLDVDGYLAPINKSWSWFTMDSGKDAVVKASKPVIAFMAFACGGLKTSMEEAACFLREDCGVSGILFGTTKPQNAEISSRLICGLFGQ